MKTTETLAALRMSSRLTLVQVITEAAKIDPNFPKTHNALLLIEERGTNNYWQIKALASVYGRPQEDVAEIAKPKKM